MNFSMIKNIIGKIMVLLSILMILPLIVSIIYFKDEGIWNVLAYAIPIVVLFVDASNEFVHSGNKNKLSDEK